MPAGTLVCEGRYWDRLPHSPGWYQPLAPFAEGTKFLFRAQHVLKGYLITQPFQLGVLQPPTANLKYLDQCNKNHWHRLKHIHPTSMDDLHFEKEMRERMEMHLHDQDPEEEEALIQKEKEKEKERKQKKSVREELLCSTLVSLA